MTSPIARTIAAAAGGTILLGGPIAAVACPPAEHLRGSIVTEHRVQRLTAAQVRENLKQNDMDASQVKYGVDAYQIVYRTTDLHGASTTASGLIVLPRNGQHRLRVVNYTHGTMAGKSEAPSVDDHGKSSEGLMLASAGYAAVEPDYLGLGLGPGHHPYLNSRTETSASIDMLKAAFSFADGRFDPRVLVTGFSQGGKVAMLVGKALQGREIPGVRLAALAPISGPYDLMQAEMPAIFDGQLSQAEATYYITYLLTSWNRIYHLYDKPSEAFQKPYDTTLVPLYDGNHTDDEIFAKLPATPEQLLTPKFLELLKHPTGRLADALQVNDNSCTGWEPTVPTRIYASHGDEVVSIQNAYSCLRHLPNATLVDVGNLQHLDSGRHGLAAALRFFLSDAPPFG
jgi:pimeloyl-ACP methyl ester carboxylesterase